MNHTTSIVSVTPNILETRTVSLQIDPRERLAALAALGLGRCPAAIVARSTGRSVATVHGWRQPGLVGGLRALDLLQAPRPFARVVLGGLTEAHAPAPFDGLSRSSLAAVLARVAGLLLVVAQEDPATLTDEQLRERRRALDEAEEQLRARRQPYDHEALRREIDRRRQRGEG